MIPSRSVLGCAAVASSTSACSLAAERTLGPGRRPPREGSRASGGAFPSGSPRPCIVTPEVYLSTGRYCTAKRPRISLHPHHFGLWTC